MSSKEKNSKGKLYGIGVGPGDPELMTLKAYRLINESNILAYPAPEVGDGLAFEIVSSIININKEVNIPSNGQQNEVIIDYNYEYTVAHQMYMQGDFDCANDLLQSGGDLHLNGYKCTTTEIHNYGGGNIWAEPGSSIEFDTTGGFNKMYGASPTTMTFVASGEAAYQATTDAAGTNTEGVYTNTEVVTSGTSQMSVSYWIQIPSDSNFWDTSLLRCVWGFGGIFTGDPTVASHPGMWAHTIQSSYIKNDFYS